mgnify:CR=1 FL=1
MPLFPIGSESSQSGPVIVPPGGSTGPLQQLGQTSGTFQPTDDPLANRPVHQIDALTDLPAIRGNDEAAINQEILAINDRLRAIITDLKVIFGTIADSRTCKQLCQDNILQVDAHSDIVSTIQRLPPGCVLQLPFMCFPCPPPCEPPLGLGPLPPPLPPPAMLLIATDLVCVPRTYLVGNREATITVIGGTPPYVWITDHGSIQSTGVNTAKVTINAGIDYFKPFLILGNFSSESLQDLCLNDFAHPNYTVARALGGAAVIGYDCSGEPLGENFWATGPGKLPIYVNGAEVAHENAFFIDLQYPGFRPLGNPNIAGNLTSTISTNSGDCVNCSSAGTGVNWIRIANCCCPNNFDPVSYTITAIPAGRIDCFNGGTVHSGAPAYSEILNLPGATALDQPISATQFIDVRRADMLPGGQPVTVTVVDSTGLTALILPRLPV